MSLKNKSRPWLDEEKYVVNNIGLIYRVVYDDDNAVGEHEIRIPGGKGIIADVLEKQCRLLGWSFVRPKTARGIA
jgi:hypothetical protein